MATPTVVTTGVLDNLLLITDHDGLNHRVPKTAVGNIVNSGNENADRIEIHYAGGEIVLIFESAIEVAAFLTLIDAQY